MDIDEAGRIGVGVVEVPDDEGNIVDNGRVPLAFDGVSALGLMAAASVGTGCGADFMKQIKINF